MDAAEIEFPPIGTSIRVLFFKPSGKFYTEEPVEISATNLLPVENFQLSVYRAVGGRLRGMWAVSADPALPWPMMFHVAEGAL